MEPTYLQAVLDELTRMVGPKVESQDDTMATLERDLMLLVWNEDRFYVRLPTSDASLASFDTASTPVGAVASFIAVLLEA